MKNIILSIFFVAALFVFGGQVARAQETRLSSSPKAFRTFFAKFLTAVRAGDKSSVASMTRFPFKYGFDAGDEGTIRSKAQFARKFADFFGKSPKGFVSERNPLFSRGDGGNYEVVTEDATHLIFVKSGGTFKFTAFIVEP
jgi:hypothetical protein